MRVTQQMLFDRYVYNLNSSLTTLMDLNMQAQTQKKINKPSDDPTGMTRILDHRDTLRSLEEYKENISTAKGWLGSQDEALTQVSTILTRAKELATQAATGTLDENNREQISYELRSLFEQLVGLSNTEFENNNIFGGKEITGEAFKEISWLTTNDSTFGSSTDFTIQGMTKDTVLVQFYDRSDTIPVGGNLQLSNVADAGVRYSTDGGKTFKTDGYVNWNGTQAQVILPSGGTSVTFHGDPTVKVNSSTDYNDSQGTWMWMRPAVQYVGDDNDQPPQVTQLGPGSSGGIRATAVGHMDTDVTVRIDNTSAVNMGQEIQYSYSTDGINWVSGNIANADLTPNAATLSIGSGGILYLASNGTNLLQPGQQFVVRPHSADIELDISSSEQVRINGVGKDIFGGIYQDPQKVLSHGGSLVAVGSSNAGRVFHSNGAGASKMGLVIQGNDEYSKNLFEVMGNLIAFTETNNQTGVQQCLANLVESQEHVMNKMADVGGRENRLLVGETIIDGLKLNEQSLISSIEDADVSELMTDLAQQQIVYESVLRTTSMIMQLNLGKFI